MSPFVQAVVMQAGINVILALGYWIAVSTGKYSFGHAAFMAIGAYTSSVLTLKLGWPLPLALVAGGLLATVGGALIGWMALRLSMLYLAIITLAFSELLITLLSQWGYVGGGSGLIGMSGTSVPLVLVCLVLLVGYLILLTRSRMGLAYQAIREDERAAMGAGIKVTLVSVGAFATSAAVTGVAGGLAAHQQLIISPDLYGPQQSLIIILFCVFGGVQYFWGAAVGAVILSLLPTFFSGLAEWYQIIYGLIFVILMIVRPQGLIGRSTGSLLPQLIRRRAAEPDTRSTAREGQTVG
ncbi:branched-chain amino acid ABC transporter permease [Actinoallomurus iriomotensis]|uniref:Branched-chain amino acid ABC transporter permease n=1 Tax=Actinoallomurus iriomotensis TaxID=478107 RepID=A0A9W6S812_9ACTN|nr:branched-chain amino acid ABC transporter permease [Actinoallomurus iriomotensis]GLY88861.1 branched-chain amino acid ABC transporter permease [Actinoallomurus iriomotensis]